MIKKTQDIILEVTLCLSHGDKEHINKKMEEVIEKRKTTQPTHAGSAGCLFKNYEIKNDEDVQRLAPKLDIPPEMWSARRISAGWLIDNLDLKGVQIGGAKISEQHGNFVVNTGSATADDVVQLVALIKTRVRNEYGMVLQEEVQYIGF